MSIKNVKVELLEFDPKNPRLPTRLENAQEFEVFRYMLNEAKVTDLMLSIAQQGYFSGEPILVIDSEQNSGKYTVVEGNRRLAALKLLANPSIAPVKKATVEEISELAEQLPKTVPVIVYPSRNDVLDYLGYRHITGVDSWDSLAKARYLKSLFEKYHEEPLEDRLKTLAKLIGSRADYVKKLLIGYGLYEISERNAFYNIPGIEENFEFSLLTTAISYTNIAEYIGFFPDSFLEKPKVNDANLKDIVEWIYKENQEGRTRLGESRNLRDLNAVVGTPLALERFKTAEVSLQEARLFTDAPNEAFSKLLLQALSRIREAYNLVNLVGRPNDSDKSLLSEIREISKNCLAVVNGKMLNDE